MYLKYSLFVLSRNFYNCFRTKFVPHQNQISCIKFLSSNVGIHHSQKFKVIKYMTKDKIPNGYTLIYRAPLENYLMACKNVSTLTFCLVSGILLHKYIKGSDLFHIQNKESNIGGFHWSDNDVIYFMIGFLAIALSVRYVISKYPLRIYKNHNSYIAIFEGQIPLRQGRLYFEKGDVSEIVGNVFNPWKNTMYKIRQKQVILLIDHFKTPSELMDMLVK